MGWNGSDPNAVPTKQRREKRRMTPAAWLAVGAIAAAAAIGYLVVGNEATDDATEEQAPASERRITKRKNRYVGTPEEAVRNAMPKGAAKGKPRKRRVGPPAELYAHLQGEDRAQAEAVQAGLDADDFKATLPAARAALKSKNVEVRQTAVDALGWFGAAALPELTGCLSDPDDDVRQAAENQWELALQEVELPSDQFNIAAAAFATLSDENVLVSLGGILSNAATEFIDGEEDEQRQTENRVIVLQALVDIIEGGKPQNVEAAKEAYGSITCNDWISVDEAERYLADPENYDPDEPGVATESDGDDVDGQDQIEQPEEPTAENTDVPEQPTDDTPTTPDVTDGTPESEDAKTEQEDASAADQPSLSN